MMQIAPEDQTTDDGTVDVDMTNQILVNNYYPETPLSGLVIDNLPYLMIIVLALGGGAAYVAVKVRSRRNSHAAA